MAGGMEEIRSGRLRNMLSPIGKRLTLRGFYTFDHPDLFPRFDAEFPRLVRSGEVITAETGLDGLANCVTAAIDMLAGAHLGKVVLRI
ncbi:hypothetical protein ACF08M_16440 [Streptomyces sp. NPDC015032]|uniref:hypothetical protein n=1 Tax=Streptomyces sp. NPDC015032 TaxID=3364937 RepID=UPI0036FE2637